jgi:hypothetical protein
MVNGTYEILSQVAVDSINPDQTTYVTSIVVFKNMHTNAKKLTIILHVLRLLKASTKTLLSLF